MAPSPKLTKSSTRHEAAGTGVAVRRKAKGDDLGGSDKIIAKHATIKTVRRTKKVLLPVDAAATSADVNVPSLPSDWAVSSRPPDYPPDASALKPGPLLQQACSGRDVHLARNAAGVDVSIEKERGKFLLIFPGTFTFRQRGGLGDDNNSNNNTNGRSGTAPSQDCGTSATKGERTDGGNGDDAVIIDDDDDDEGGNDDGGEYGHPTKATHLTSTAGGESSTPSASTSRNVAPNFGSLKGLRTETPSFHIPFADLKKNLVFRGRKVQTTSKYLMLSCSNKKNGTVACKNIFSSAIIFGRPTWEALEPTSTSPVANDAVGRISAAQDVPSGNNGILHYGGSDRTVDGTTTKGRGRGSGGGSGSARESVTDEASRQIPIFARHRGDTTAAGIITAGGGDALTFPGVKSGVERVNHPTSSERKRKATPQSRTANIKGGNPDRGSDEDMDSDSDDSFELVPSMPTKARHTSTGMDASATPATKTRLAPKRQASLKRKRYVPEDDAGSNDSDDDDDDGSGGGGSGEGPKDDEDVEESRPPTKRSMGKRGAAAKATAKKEVSRKPAKSSSAPAAPNPTGRRSASSTAQDNSLELTLSDDSDDDDDDDDDGQRESDNGDVENQNIKQPPSLKSKATAKRQAVSRSSADKEAIMKSKSRKIRSDDHNGSDDGSESFDVSSDGDSDLEVLTKKRRVAASRQKTQSTGGVAKKAPTGRIVTSAQHEEDGENNDSTEMPSTRRHSVPRRSTSGKKTSYKEEYESVGDEENDDESGGSVSGDDVGGKIGQVKAKRVATIIQEKKLVLVKGGLKSMEPASSDSGRASRSTTTPKHGTTIIPKSILKSPSNLDNGATKGNSTGALSKLKSPISISSVSPTGTKSPFRSRRKSPGAKKAVSSAQKTLDLTQDDEFNFG